MAWLTKGACAGPLVHSRRPYPIYQTGCVGCCVCQIALGRVFNAFPRAALPLASRVERSGSGSMDEGRAPLCLPPVRSGERHVFPLNRGRRTQS